ncbi:porin family protein [Flavobacterium sp. TSSA_36]|jgi:hypothetical protein|uniref:porin family protein n=1 Tax=Flavobacterium sp. TSSA_36 TaxID=3447669 RepID=UPI003F2B72AD
MKKIQVLLVAVLLISFSKNAFAQGLGVRAGYNFSNVSEGKLGNTTNRDGYYVGLYKEVPLLDKLLYIQPEVQFSKQGFSTAISDVDLSYIQVPILAKLYALKIVSVETGPQFGFKVSDKVRGLGNPDFKTFDAAWAFGASINLPFGLSVNARYISSLNEVIKNSDAKNQVFQLGAALTF